MKAGFKQAGFKQTAGFKQLFLATGILLSKNAGFSQLLKNKKRQQYFLYFDHALNGFSVLFALEFIYFPILAYSPFS